MNANAAGIKQLLELEPDIALLEPTGVNYSKLWVTKLAEAGVKVFLVGHKQLRVFRQGLRLADKDDDADALALALYYWHYGEDSSRYVRQRDPVVARLRDCLLRLHHLNRLKSPVFNRLKQDLAWQFPEMAEASMDATLFWRWLAGSCTSQKYERLYHSSAGLGLTADAIAAAQLFQQLLAREAIVELRMRKLLTTEPRFLPYRKIMKQFGFGERTEAIVISQIFPLENFLKDGRPEVKKRKGRHSGKPTNRYLSERRFVKALGVAPQREESGDSKRTKKAGSQSCRTALWQWIFTRIGVRRNRPKTKVGRQLGTLMDEQKVNKPVKLARAKVAGKAARMLFAALVTEICGNPSP